MCVCVCVCVCGVQDSLLPLLALARGASTSLACLVAFLEVGCKLAKAQKAGQGPLAALCQVLR